MTTITATATRTQPANHIFRADGEGPSHVVLGMQHRYKLLASESGGQFMAFVISVPPGCGAPMHSHERDTESFFVLEGEITARFPDGTSKVAGAYDFLWFGAHQPHSFANEGDTTARALIVQSPGTEGERFFAEVAELEAAGDLVPMRDVPVIADRHGISLHMEG